MRTKATSDWANSPHKVIDIRSDVESDSEPFMRILAAAEATSEGHAFIVIAPFEPLAIYPALATRGYACQSEHVSTNEWVTRVTRSRLPVPAALPMKETYPQ